MGFFITFVVAGAFLGAMAESYDITFIPELGNFAQWITVGYLIFLFFAWFRCGPTIYIVITLMIIPVGYVRYQLTPRLNIPLEKINYENAEDIDYEELLNLP